METKRKILLVDDHIIVRDGLKELIEKLGPYSITQQFDDGETMLSWLGSGNTADLVILDLNMPGLSGDMILERLSLEYASLPVLMLTLNEDERMIVKLFRLGARGYLKKNCSSGILKEALHEIFRCGYYHNEFLTFSLQRDTPAAKKSEQDDVLEQLTQREREFLKWVCHEKEYTYEQIADKMKVQHRTVDGYREELFSKFGIKSKTGLVLFVLKHKLFDLL